MNTVPAEEITVVKRSRGRPRKTPVVSQVETIKRGRGRPRKYTVLEQEVQSNGLVKPVIKKVDQGQLVQHMFGYFTKLLILHNELSREAGKFEPVFKRLKMLDFQMVEVCKALLCNEYKIPSIENKEGEL